MTGTPAVRARRRSAAIRRAAATACGSSRPPPSNSRSLIMSMMSSAAGEWSGALPCRLELRGAMLLSLRPGEKCSTVAANGPCDACSILCAMLKPLEVLQLYPEHDYTLAGAFESRARRDPQRPFIVYGGKTWSWAKFGE